MLLSLMLSTAVHERFASGTAKPILVLSETSVSAALTLIMIISIMIVINVTIVSSINPICR